jgi:hypothetical protein
MKSDVTPSQLPSREFEIGVARAALTAMTDTLDVSTRFLDWTLVLNGVALSLLVTNYGDALRYFEASAVKRAFFFFIVAGLLGLVSKYFAFLAEVCRNSSRRAAELIQSQGLSAPPIDQVDLHFVLRQIAQPLGFGFKGVVHRAFANGLKDQLHAQKKAAFYFKWHSIFLGLHVICIVGVFIMFLFGTR